MNRLIILLLFATVPLVAVAQEVKDSVMLKEVVVQAARIVDKPDGKIVYPTSKQKETSKDGYAILSKLALPNIRVDEVLHTISGLPALGEIQVRINDVPASKNDLLSMDMQMIQYVQFIQNPGVRYGEDVGCVINFIVKKAESGYALGTDASQTLVAANGNANLFAKYNKGKSEWSFNYGLSYQNLKGSKYEESADYLLPENVSSGVNSASPYIYQIKRKDLESRSKNMGHELTMKYNLTDSNRYVLQIELSGNFSRSPKNFNRRQTIINGKVGDVMIESRDRTVSPILDVYFNCNFARHQSLSANMVGTYVGSNYHYAYQSEMPYSYSTKGNMYSLSSEVLYENVLRVFTWSSGWQYRQRYTDNVYEGNIEALSAFRNSDVKIFSQVKGSWKRLDFVLGAGFSRQYYRQATNAFDHWLFRPKFTLSYRLTDRLKLKYDITTRQKPPRSEKMVNAAVQSNEIDIGLGNPELKPGRRTEHTATLLYQRPRFYSEINTLYRINAHTDMPYIDVREGQDRNVKFIYGNKNQEGINLLHVSNYTSYDIVPEKLSVSFWGGLARCFNYGDTYKHHYSSWFGGGQLTAYLGKLTMTANADSGWRWLEGETKGYQGYAYYLTASYRLGDFTFGMYWQHCFEKNPLLHREELVNKYVHKVTTVHNRDFGNMLSLRISWRLSKGRKTQDVEKYMNNRETDSGILKQKDN